MRLSALIATTFTTLGVLAPPGHAIDIAINSKQTYLHAASADSALDAIPIELAVIGVAPGDRVELTQLGDFDNGPGGDVFTTLVGVFSASPTLLPKIDLHRVVDAIEAGVDVLTTATFFGSEPTDVPEDFVVVNSFFPAGTICVVVPPGATHLFIVAHDSLYEDNGDPDGDYGVRIVVLDDCAADLDGSGAVDGGDLGVVLAGWGPSTTIGALGDLDCNGIVDGSDLGLLLAAWGACP